MDRLLAAILGNDTLADGAEPGPTGHPRSPAAAAVGRPRGGALAGLACGVTPPMPRTANCGGSTPSGWTSPGAGSLAERPCSTARPRARRRRWFPQRRRRDAGSRRRPGDALAGGQAGLQAQPAGTEAPAQNREAQHGHSGTSDKVDITELKARHPLGDAVEAAGIVLHGKGRVRQGVCPFHQEAEGSFTVYADSRKVLLLRLRGAATCWTSWAGWRADPCRGHPAAG